MENEIGLRRVPKNFANSEIHQENKGKSTLPRAINLDENDYIPSLRSKGRDKLLANF
jgi:hypothetical protein